MSTGLHPNEYQPKHRYLYRPPPANHPRLLRALRLTPPPAITAVDLRAFMLPVRDQGQEGSCSGHATGALREALRSIALGAGNLAQVPSLSPAYLYARTRMIEGTFPDDAGATIIDEMTTLQNYGVCPETDLPYSGMANEAPTPACDVSAVPFRAGPPQAVDMTDPSGIENALANDQPVVIGMPVYSSFESTGSDGLVPVPDTKNEQLLGGHALLLVGFDRPSQRLITRNSWSSSWGLAGYALIPYAMIPSFFESWTAPIAL